MALAVVGVLLALWFFTTRDDATTSSPAAAGPGRPLRAGEGRGIAADLDRGNVVLLVGSGQRRAAEALAQDIAGPPAPALRDAGQAVIVRAVPGGATDAVTAYAKGRAITTPTARTPALRAFVEYWLGRAAG